MEGKLLLQTLEGVAARLGVRVVYADLRDGAVDTLGGGCRLRGERYLFIERTASREEKVSLLVEELRRWHPATGPERETCSVGAPVDERGSTELAPPGCPVAPATGVPAGTRADRGCSLCWGPSRRGGLERAGSPPGVPKGPPARPRAGVPPKRPAAWGSPPGAAWPLEGIYLPPAVRSLLGEPP